MITTYGPGCRDCRFDVVEIATLDEWPHALYPAHLLLCLDARSVDAEVIATLAGRLMRGGLGAVLCHGPDCERVHDVFEEAREREAEAAITTSWHEDEPFADTLFSWAMFRPDPAYPVPDVRTVVLINQPDRARDVHRWLPAFCTRR